MSINMDAKSDPPVSDECREHGKALRESRLQANKTLCDVADSLDISLELASRFERGVTYNLHITAESWVS